MMRAVVLYDLDDIRIEDRPIPELRGGDMLVRTAASGICTGDVMPWYIRRKAPLVLGHEPAGIVAALGDPAPTRESGIPFRVGDRVFVHHHAPCFTCRFCLRGDYVQCPTWRASKIEPGAMAEYFRVPPENTRDALLLPDGVAFPNAALVEPLACVVKSLRRARLREDDVVYVIGCGVMGLMHVILANARGHRVLASDFAAERRDAAVRLGAEPIDAAADPLHAVHGRTDGRGADVVICAPGSTVALEHAIDSAVPGGTVVMFTPLEPGERFAFDQSSAYFRDLTLVNSYSCGPNDTSEALDLLARGVVTCDKLGAECRPLSGVAQAYADLRMSRILKPIIEFPQPASRD